MTERGKEHSKIAMILLAAGASKRMNAIKQLLPWKHTNLIGHAIESGLASDVNDVFVVLGANFNAISNQIKNYPISIIHNVNWEDGMGSSIASAFTFFQKKSLTYDAVLIALVDQPLIDVKYYNLLIYKYITSNKYIVSGMFNNRCEVPAIFGSSYFIALAELRKDYGARKIISANKDDLITINNERKLVDVDSPSDYKTLFQKFGGIK